MKTKPGQIITVLACAFSTTAYAQDVRFEADQNDFLWTFENAVGTVSTSLYNNGNLQRLIAVTSLGGSLTNENPKFGNVSLKGPAVTDAFKPGLSQRFDEMTILFWLERNTNASTTLIQRFSGTGSDPGAITLQFNSGGGFSWNFVPTNGSISYNDTLDNSFAATLGVYNHVALTFDHGVMTWYYNGVAHKTTNLTLINPSASFIPAANTNSGSTPGRWRIDPRASGFVDDFAIYNQILTTNQLQFIIANGLQAFNVPEPSILVLASAAAVAGLLFRRRR